MDYIVELLDVLTEDTNKIKLKLNMLELKIDKLDKSINDDLVKDCKKSFYRFV